MLYLKYTVSCRVHTRPNSAWQHTKDPTAHGNTQKNMCDFLILVQYFWASMTASSPGDCDCFIYIALINLVPWLLRPHSFETTFIWDHDIWDHVHLRPRHLRPRSFETTFIRDHFIWDHSHLRTVHLMRPHSYETFSSETTFIWDHSHLRPPLFETTFIETTFIWDHIHFTPC